MLNHPIIIDSTANHGMLHDETHHIEAVPTDPTTLSHRTQPYHTQPHHTQPYHAQTYHTQPYHTQPVLIAAPIRAQKLL